MPADSSVEPTAALIIRPYNGRVYYEAKFRHQGKQVMRRIGPAWLERSEDGELRRRRGRVASGHYDERHAHVRAAELVHAYVTEQDEKERRERERLERGVTFREIADAYLTWLERVKGAKPSTLRQHRSDLAEPGVPYKRGAYVTNGHIMRAIGDRPAVKVTRAEVEALLDTVAATGVSPRTVNRVRSVVSAVFRFGMRSTVYRLADNPVQALTSAVSRVEPRSGLLLPGRGRDGRSGALRRPAPKGRRCRQL